MILSVAITGLISCSGNKDENEQSKELPVTVTLAEPGTGSSNSIAASGQIESVQTANISTRVMGRITNIYVKAGDKVNKGQLLATISDDDIRAKKAQADAMVSEAEAALVNARKDYERFEALFRQQSATAKELDNVTLQYNAAKSRVEGARQVRTEVLASLSYSSLTAPFSGVVTQKLAEVGNIANPGMPIITIEQNGILQVSAAVAESDIAGIHKGDEAKLLVKSTGKNFDAGITQLNPSSQFTGGQYIIKISIPEEEKKDLYPGMYVNVSIPRKEEQQVTGDAVLVPVSAIFNRDELTGIYTVSANNTALLRWVRLGKNFGDRVEVVSGLSRKEKFILTAAGKLYNGAPVTVK